MTQLALQVDGPVFNADTPGSRGEIAGSAPAPRREPDLVVGATNAADVSAAVRYAAAHDLPVGVQGSGHVLTTLTGGVLVTTSRLADVRVDADARTARFEAGTASPAIV